MIELNTIYNEDYLETMKRIPDGTIDLVLTDPPYGISWESPYKRYDGNNNEWEAIENDDGSFDYQMMFQEIIRVSKRTIVFGAENFYQHIPHKGRWIVWDKRTLNITNEMLGSPFEMAWCSDDKGQYRLYRVLHGGVVNADAEPGLPAKRFHPTQKPVKLMRHILNDYSKPGDTVYDPFMGSGTTALACKDLGRNFIGSEISAEYCKIAESRLAQGVLDFWGVGVKGKQ